MSGCQERGCDASADVTIVGPIKSGPRKGETVRWSVCRAHVWPYRRDDSLTIEILVPGLAWCPRCDRLIAQNGQARHGYTMLRNGYKSACGEEALR